MDTNILDKKEQKRIRFRERQEAERNAETAMQRAKKLKRLYSLGIVFIVMAVIGIFAYSKLVTPGQYDEFAKCLGKKAVVYGSDACMYTQKQLSWFGKSAKYLNYVRCVDNKQLCDEKGISITPTWEINGKMYEQVQSFERLSQLTGCEIK